MTYQVFARKYRPQSFAEIKGQEPIVKTLENAIAQNRLHHAYLFCGARGVGKTSLARIFAKSLNCEKGPTLTPCQSCASCLNITTSKCMDVLEIDGASNTGVDDVRELREQAKYLPSGGKHKIYIIDEVHMLSQSAFNALLKILEEPPPHLIFIFATTEVHKIPITILSRCQRFDFRKLGGTQLSSHLTGILSEEGLSLDQECLSMVVRGAEGSVRDALSLLDQVIGFCGKEVSVDRVREILGFSDRLAVNEMLKALLEGDASLALAKAATYQEKGYDLKTFCQSLLENIRHLLVLSEGAAHLVDVSPGELAELKSLQARADSSQLIFLFQILSKGLEQLSRSEFPGLIFEITLIKMIRCRDWLSVSEILEEMKGADKAVEKTVAKVKENTSLPQSASHPKNWDEFVKFVLETKPQVGSLLEQARCLQEGPGDFELGFEASSLYADMLKDRLPALQGLADGYFGGPVKIKLTPVQGKNIKDLPPTHREIRENNEQKKREEVRHQALSNPLIEKAQSILGAKVKEVRELK